MDKTEQKIMNILRANAEEYLEKAIKNFRDANTYDEDTSMMELSRLLIGQFMMCCMLLIDEGMKNQYVSVELRVILRQIIDEVFKQVGEY